MIWGRWHGIAIRRLALALFSATFCSFDTLYFSIISKICKQTMTVYLFLVSSRSVFFFDFVSIIPSEFEFFFSLLKIIPHYCRSVRLNTRFLCVCLSLFFFPVRLVSCLFVCECVLFLAPPSRHNACKRVTVCLHTNAMQYMMHTHTKLHAVIKIKCQCIKWHGKWHMKQWEDDRMGIKMTLTNNQIDCKIAREKGRKK